MVSVQKRPGRPKPWVVRWRPTPGGPERSESYERKKQADVRAAQLELERAPPSDMTFAQWADRWQQTLAARWRSGELAATTVEGYESKLRVHLLPRLGPVLLADLTVGHVADVLTDVAAETSPSNAANVRAVLSKCLTDAQDRRLLADNPAMRAPKPKVDRPAPSSFTPAEFGRILDTLPDDSYGRVVRWMLLTGMRTSEAVGLRWEHVDLDTGTYRVEETVHRLSQAASALLDVEGGTVTGRGKTAASRQPTSLASAAVELLRTQKAAQAAARLAAQVWADPGVVFASEVGTRLSQSNIRRALNRTLDAAGVDRQGASGRGRGMHELRRTFATQLLADGVPVHVVQRLGRWSSPQVLLNSYAGVLEEQQQDAADRLAARLHP